MSLVCRPQREDFFPKLKRGHGTCHDRLFRDQGGAIGTNKAWEQTMCVDPTCSLNQPKSKNLHEDKKANLEEWCSGRGLSLKYDTPGTAMVKATGGVTLASLLR